MEQENTRRNGVQQRKGILLAGGRGSRLFPLTHSVSKQLIPVYDKPMIYYPLCALMMSGIKEVLVISTPRDLPRFIGLLGDGGQWGMKLVYAEQDQPSGLAQALLIAEDFLGGGPTCLALGDNLFYGVELEDALRAASARTVGATIFGYESAHPEGFGVVEFSDSGQVLSLEEKPVSPKSNFAVPGLYFYDGKAAELASELRPSTRNELEITDLNRAYLALGELHVEILGRGTAWLDTGTPECLAEASEFVRVIQRRQGFKISCPEEIAYRLGWINHDGLRESVLKYEDTEYGEYLLQLWKQTPA